ncbi:Mur ligase family protein [Clostridium sp. E02]|uniref:bifunctional folylpolyglutamate synthase/dihydrofolate synthase n=1 Tax=Clostridium sp. E02 TaxID=2487134 RepID=UPI000F52FD82|nr:Mur ligase family protein [Clostridium sp. E02]
MTVKEAAVDYLSQIPMWTRKKNSLEDIRIFLKEMGEPDEGMKIIHVAGTNGKGSVCAFLQSVLLKAGYRVGTFTSPHLLEIRERFMIQGEKTSWNVFLDSFSTVRVLVEKMMDKGYNHPSYFEFLFYMALSMFQKEKMEVVILETGMGGRLDTTNVIRNPMVAVITSISLDHTEILGDTIEKIAMEKAGIIKEGVPVVYDGNDQKAVSVIKDRASKLHSPCYSMDRHAYTINNINETGIHASLQKKEGDFVSLFIPSPADYQVRNGLLALRALEVSGLFENENPEVFNQWLISGYASMHWPGRMEEVLPGVFLDGAHNPGGIEAFIKTAADLCMRRKKRAFVLFSAVIGKDHHKMIHKITRLLPLDLAAVAHISSERGLKTGILFEEFEAPHECEVERFEEVEEAFLSMLRNLDEGHLLFCVGSLYLIGEIKAVLRRNGYD